MADEKTEQGRDVVEIRVSGDVVRTLVGISEDLAGTHAAPPTLLMATLAATADQLFGPALVEVPQEERREWVQATANALSAAFSKVLITDNPKAQGWIDRAKVLRAEAAKFNEAMNAFGNSGQKVGDC